MPNNNRRYLRFPVPGATVSYELHGFPRRPFKEACPVLSLSKGGLSFQTNKQLKFGRKLTVVLTSKEAPIRLQVQVIYCIQHLGMNYLYHVGVAFAPFAASKGCNSPEAFNVLDRLEKEYAR